MNTQKLDVYSDHMVPFDLAAWCRGRRFHPESVALARALQDKDAARKAVRDAEQALEAAEDAVRATVASLQAHVEKEGT